MIFLVFRDLAVIPVLRYLRRRRTAMPAMAFRATPRDAWRNLDNLNAFRLTSRRKDTDGYELLALRRVYVA